VKKQLRDSPLSVRPYQLLCIVCSLGEDPPGPTNKVLKNILQTVRAHPDIPTTLRCNAGDVYAYHDAGVSEDTPEGKDYNIKRDLDILQALDMAPGTALPARVLCARLLKRVATVSGICAYETVISEAWKGCPKAASGHYEKGLAKGLDAIILPRREEDLAQEKTASMKALCSAKEVKVRPHILLCAICQYAGGVRPPFKPDNLPEMLDIILNKNPDLLITLVRGADWMMCAPCPSRNVELNACFCGQNKSGGLYNELKDVNVLQRLGLTFGTTMKAGELYKLIFEKIPTVAGVCALNNRDLPSYSVWRDSCGDKKPPGAYEKGRDQLMGRFN
jgi:hypothetical protein